MEKLSYEDAKQLFINEYTNFKLIEDLQPIIQNVIIPYFDLFACDLEDLIKEINLKYQIENESMDYIEMIFNPNLYHVLLSLRNNEDTLVHYSIILVEFTKYQIYLNTKEKLDDIVKDNTLGETVFYDGIKKAAEERVDKSIEVMKKTYYNLIKNYKDFKFSIYACQELFTSNNCNFISL